MAGVIQDFLDVSVGAGTTAKTVANNPRRALIVWAKGNSSSPDITYNGTSFTFINNSHFTDPIHGYDFYSPWVGYIIAPTAGSNNLVNNSGNTCAVLSVYDVDQSNPITLLQSASRALSVSPLNINDTTNYLNSWVLKAVSFESSGGYSNGGSEVATLGLTQDIGSYLDVGPIGPTTMSTTWPVGTHAMAFQTFELKWGGQMSASLSVSAGNAASRLATVARTQTLMRTISASAGYALSRIATSGRIFAENLTVTAGNAAGRLATVTATFRGGWHTLKKNTSTIRSIVKTRQGIVLATAGMYRGFGAFNYSGGEVLDQGHLPVVTSQAKSGVSVATTIIKS